MKILFLIIGPVSFKSANFIQKFINQLDIQVHSLHVLAERFTLSSVQVSKKVDFFSMSENFNESVFKKLLENNKYDLIIVVNIDLLLFNDKNVAFKKSYLKHINVPVLFFITNNKTKFKEGYAELSGVPFSKTKINAPFCLLKSCPPYIPDTDNEEKNPKGIKTFYWKNLESFAFLNKYEARAKLKEQLMASEESKIVTLIFDIENVIIAGNAGLFYHYRILIECLYRYLVNLDIPCNLIIGNFSPLMIEQYSPDVKIYFYSLLEDEDLELAIRSTDLIISESIADTSLIEAANLKLPVINLKNTLMLDIVKDEEGKDAYDIVYNFDELTEFAKSKVEDLMDNCPSAIFPYLAFPNVATIKFEETKVFGHYIFTFSEVFDEKGTTALIKDLLLNEDARKEEVYRIEQYLALRADALDAQEILDCM